MLPLEIRALTFARQVAQQRTRETIVAALDKLAAPLDLQVYAVWQIPINDTLPNSYVVDLNLIQGATVPPDFWPSFWDARKANGTSAMPRLARLNIGPFTWLEGAKTLRLTGADRWFHDLARKHGMPDGFYCPQGDMIVAFWSPKPVRLDASARGILNFAASIAAQQLRPHMVLPRKKPRALSPSETKALLYYSLGESPAEIARRLSSTGKRPISTKTVHSFLDRAREKLKAKSRAHAVRIAIHGRLITYALFVGSSLL